MINKTANISFTNIDRIDSSGTEGMIRTASSSNGLSSSAKSVIAKEVSKHKNALFFRAKAIEADVPNNNGDSFSKAELKKSFQTFVGVPFFTNHDNQNIERAKGKIVWSEWVEEENSIYVVAFVDRDAYPNLCRGIEQEYMTGVSMGASVEYSVCNLCGNKAATVDDYCTHIRNFKGRRFTGSVKDVVTGETKHFKNQLVYEDNHGLRFIELSGVADPACIACRISVVYDNGEFTGCSDGACSAGKAASVDHNALLKAASTCYNDVSAIKYAGMQKHASQQDIDQLNQCLATLEQVSVKLIQNRANVEMEFASDLVEVLANLQDFVDQLVQAGYGQLPEATGGQVPGVSPDQSQAAPAAAPATQPVSAEEEIGTEPGTTNVDEPAMKAPEMPSALKDFNQTTRPSSPSKLTRPIKPKKSESEESMRRMPNKAANDRQRTKEVLDGSWKEKIKILSTSLKEAINNDLTTSGGRNMSKGMNVEAKKGSDLHDVVIEEQLGSERTDKEADVAMEKQLDPERTGKEADAVTEKQLEKGDLPRTGEKTDVATEKQLDSGRTGKEAEAVTEKQLDPDRTGKEADVTTEKQLEKAPWGRMAASSVKKHVVAAAEIMAKVVVASGSTPDQVAKSVSSFAGGTSSSKLALAYEIWNNESSADDIHSVASRNNYWGKKGIVSSASSKTMREMLVAYASEAVKSGGLNPEAVVESFGQIVANKALHLVEEKVDAIMATASVPVEVEPSMSEQIGDFFAAKEPEKVKASSSVADHLIEASLSEIGASKGQSGDQIRQAAEKFAKTVCPKHNLKFASLVNVTVDGETVTIAVETDGGESVEIPINDVGGTDDTAIEDDFGGGTDDLATETSSAAPAPAPAAPAAGAAPAPAAGAAPAPAAGAAPAPAAGAITGEDILGMASSKKKVKTAQFGGGAPAVPGAGAGAAAPEDTSAMAPEAMPEEGGAQTLTNEVSDEEKIPGDEQKQAGTICPICGSDDTVTGRKDQTPGQFDCENCGAKYTLHVNVDILNPEELFGGAKKDGDLSEPEIPEMPVAASVKVDKKVFASIMSSFSNGKVVCPGCGKSHAAEGGPGSHSIKCASCGTSCQRDLIINPSSPDDVQMRVEWKLLPKSRKCASCNKARKAFASDLAFGKMIKSASKAVFPAEQAAAWIAKNYGKDTVVTYGPAKGAKLADTVIKQLSSFGLDKVKFMKRLCEVQTQADPMEKCVKMQKRQSGMTDGQAKRACECIRERYRTEVDDNLYMEAFAGMIGNGVLRRMAGYDVKKLKVKAEEKKDDGDVSIADIKVEKPGKKASANGETKIKTDKLKTVKVVKKLLSEEVSEVQGKGKALMGEEKDTIPASKEPEVPAAKKDGYLGDEKAAAPESTDEVVIPVKIQYLGEEKKDGDINTTMTGQVATAATAIVTLSAEASDKIGEAAPVSKCKCVPRADAKMGDEKPVEAKEPSVPSKGDAAMMGDEKSSIPSAEEATAPHGSDAEKVEVTTRVAASSELESHRAKIAMARHDKAVKIAAMMLGRGELAEKDFDDMVETLAAIPLDKQEKIASKMAGRSIEKTASSVSGTAIVIEDKGIEKPQQEKSLQEKIASQFTIGNYRSDKLIREQE